MYFYRQMLMRLQKPESSFERIRVLRMLRLLFLLSHGGCLNKKPGPEEEFETGSCSLQAGCESSGFERNLIALASPEPSHILGTELQALWRYLFLTRVLRDGRWEGGSGPGLMLANSSKSWTGDSPVAFGSQDLVSLITGVP